MTWTEEYGVPVHVVLASCTMVIFARLTKFTFVSNITNHYYVFAIWNRRAFMFPGGTYGIEGSQFLWTKKIGRNGGCWGPTTARLLDAILRANNISVHRNVCHLAIHALHRLLRPKLFSDKPLQSSLREEEGKESDLLRKVGDPALLYFPIPLCPRLGLVTSFRLHSFLVIITWITPRFCPNIYVRAMLNGMTADAVSNLSYQNKLSLLSAARSPMPFVELICYISIDWVYKLNVYIIATLSHYIAF
ncbi:Uncharacterized protein HZ326_19580 [Fusarium oxysporum f. sp. albedinis]|nr:Uncharacterized protein HZ326_19580 [Fusarium oxysporum f. sp. albedinis]